MDTRGRLLVLGGYGTATGASNITSFRGGEGWFDDVSDGYVLAAVSHDPLSSSGIPRALASGAAAARAIDAHLRSNRDAALGEYDAAQAHGFDAYNQLRSAYYAVEQRWPDAPFWSRRRAHA